MIKHGITFLIFPFYSSYFQDGTTPLILAAAGGHTYCVMELLDQGADPNSRRLTGTTPLFLILCSVLINTHIKDF